MGDQQRFWQRLSLLPLDLGRRRTRRNKARHWSEPRPAWIFWYFDILIFIYFGYLDILIFWIFGFLDFGEIGRRSLRSSLLPLDLATRTTTRKNCTSGDHGHPFRIGPWSKQRLSLFPLDLHSMKRRRIIRRKLATCWPQKTLFGHVKKQATQIETKLLRSLVAAVPYTS